MGLIWSMVPEPGQQKGRRIIKKDVTTPLKVDMAVLDGRVPEQAVLSPETPALSSTISQRLYMAPGVSRTEITAGRLRGTLFMPEGTQCTCRAYNDASRIFRTTRLAWEGNFRVIAVKCPPRIYQSVRNSTFTYTPGHPPISDASVA